MAIEAINTQATLLQNMQQMRSEVIAPAADGMQPDQVRADQVNFTQVINSALNAVDNQQHRAASLQTAVETGQSDDLVGAMVASQKAGLSFSALVQVRNRLVSGFDEIMRMPV